MKYLLTTLIGLAVMVVWSPQAAVKDDGTQLQGEWSMVSGSADGQPMPEQMRKQMKRVCKGDEITVMMGDQTFLKAKIIIDATKNPKTIDYEMTEGVTKGKKQLGIYELDGDTFKSCFAKPGADRPTNFEPGEGRTVSVWKLKKGSIPKSD
ncbi:MAG TPA: TIGR03067 domain-containing protein [Verrucomicrobiae bacterium]|nr:TIGR03067 domain-containing protein [Verrucomicrobiae bacterium]